MHPVWILWEHPSGISQGHTSFCFKMKQTVVGKATTSIQNLNEFQFLSGKNAQTKIIKAKCMYIKKY